jgi:hypothetical protein
LREIIGKLLVADKLYEYTVSRPLGKQTARRVVKMLKRLLTGARIGMCARGAAFAAHRTVRSGLSAA